MDIIRSLSEWCERLPQLVQDGEKHLIFTIHPETEIAWGGWEDDLDRDYCQANGIPVYNQNRNGGTIVCSAGNVGLGILYDNREYREWVFVHLLRDFCAWLEGKGLVVTFEKNDVLVDGYKVASGCGYNLPPDFHRTYEGVQISVYQDMETIIGACKKPMVKVPRGLGEYGLTTQEVSAWCAAWLREHIGVEVDA